MELLIRKLRPDARLPARATDGATGFDLYACLDAPLLLTPAPQMVPTGIAIEFPRGFDAQVRPRSGLSSKGVGVAFGTVDADYRGELLVTMWTFGETGVVRAAATATASPSWCSRRWRRSTSWRRTELSATARGDGGHGSTGR